MVLARVTAPGTQRKLGTDMLAIKNAKVVLEEGIIWNGVVICDGERILEVGDANHVSIPDDTQVIDAGGKYIAPGLIDIHAHGGNMTFFRDNPHKAAEMHFKQGTTTILPTMYQTDSLDDFKRGIDNYRNVEKDAVGRSMIGFYMEGPYLNPKYGSNAKNGQWKDSIDDKLMKELVDYAGQDVAVWCVGPEREGIERFCKYAKTVKPAIKFSMAHSECKPWQAYSLKKYGLCSQTHHGNATGVNNPIIPSNVGIRDVGPDETALYDDDFYVELISDSMGIHVKPHMLSLVVKIKGFNRVILVTDHYPENCENPEGPIMGGEKAPDLGYCITGEVCGSMMTLNVACRNMMAHTGCSLPQVIKFASLNPARMLGIDNLYGSVEKGKIANLIIIDDMLNVEKVIFEGQVQK